MGLSKRRPQGAMYCQPDHRQQAYQERTSHNMANLYTFRNLEDVVLPRILESLSYPELR